MLSIDTNLLFHAYAADRPEHRRAFAWISEIASRSDVAISEFVLVEFYRLLRNPAVLQRPLDASEAVGVVSAYRVHPRWKLIGFSPGSRELHSELFRRMAKPGIAYRRVYDVRLGLTLAAYGVTEFATANVRDFQDFGFRRVWNPLAETAEADVP